MKAIYACKMYKSSRRKDKIKAAMNDPLNKELVQQLKEYLDYEVTPEPKVDSKPTEPESHIQPTDKSTPSTSGHGPAPSSPAHTSSGLSDGMFKFDEDDSERITPEDVVDDIDDTDDENNEDSNDEVEESIDVNKSAIVSSQEVCTSVVDKISEIKGALNARDDTSGVNRIICKNDEMWVYYNDSINLNNVMGPVIELLNAANYNYLEFNRLARSDNAIVFQINLTSSDELKPVQDVTEDD